MSITGTSLYASTQLRFIGGNSLWVMRITEAGQLEFNPEIEQTEAGRETIKILLDLWQQSRGLARNSELLEANTRYLTRARKSEEYLVKAMLCMTTVCEDDVKLHDEIREYLKEPWK